MIRRRRPVSDRSFSPPLAEARWLWRRLYAFMVSAGLWVLLMRTVGRTPPEMLPKMTDGLMGLLALILVLYLVAPTAQQLAAMIATARPRLPGGRP
ncbi:MAG: hypothetical protein ACT6R7_04310 [Brevundimonas aurantiaca]|jgi:hypothetical protein|uniref:Na+-transporting NADH:ubiquinone oxidoreductase subunit NqrB n=1 Tax=Brevundimonas aurantiaca TaxID=74316 RepID=A0A7W9C994_9CAUL|nr:MULTISPECIES: hypothetical protein [Brevundimonas]MBB1180572.1 hypothetical protein [Pseudomonas sp. FW305-3-2-15-E-TSA4]HAF80904.1 hypothetical protein [Brevundimonas sp.]MBB5741320.1 Na+-transporting NADH:ubiquinone oxidoreductase subunit NqrB [Brevundimonas aurantiaca]MCC4295588.1 hypothetical protein [Brevundimonas aurantiaca]QFU31448.1 hypothetical protein BSP_07230 [Brevundimonas sp. Bb-A]